MKALWKDPIIEEIREIRKKIDKLSPEEFEADMQSIRERYKDQLVNFPPRRIKVPVQVKTKKKTR